MNTIKTINTIAEATTTTTIAVHDGLFHLDELVAISLLVLGTSEPSDEGVTSAWDDITIIRTRDFDQLFHATFVVDVGMEFDGMRAFDHHQKTCPKHSNGILYAATGLVWEATYKKIASDFNVDADKLYKAMEGFILAIDANDTGSSEPDERTVKLPTIAEMVATFKNKGNKAFSLCLQFIYEYVCQYIKNAVEEINDEQIIQEGIKQAKDGILVLPKFCLGWKDTCIDTPIKIALIDAGNGEWSITSASVKKGSQECKCACPEALRANRVLGDNPVVFIHKTGFTGKVKADSLEQAYKSALEWVNG